MARCYIHEKSVLVLNAFGACARCGGITRDVVFQICPECSEEGHLCEYCQVDLNGPAFDPGATEYWQPIVDSYREYITRAANEKARHLQAFAKLRRLYPDDERISQIIQSALNKKEE